MATRKIEVLVTVSDDEPAACVSELLAELCSRFQTITAQEFMEGGEDLMGYDRTMVQEVHADYSRERRNDAEEHDRAD